jgi:hypothetical protein
VRDEIRVGLRLSPILLVALLLAAFVWRTDTAAISGLFQSSPVGTPTLMPTASATPEMPTEFPAPTEALPEPPSLVTATPVLIPTAGLTATLTPTLQLVPTLPPTLTPETTMAPVSTVTPATGSAEPTPVEASATPDDRQRYAEGDSGVKFEWGMLFDSASLFLSYAWLFCGLLIFLAIPVVFVVLWIASKRRQQQ